MTEGNGMGREQDGAEGINEELLEAALRRLLGAAGGMPPQPPPFNPYGAAYPTPGAYPPSGTYSSPRGYPPPGASPPPGYAPPGYGVPGYQQPMGGWPGQGPGAGQGGQSFQQALIWAALGAAAAWVLSDPAVRDKLIKQAMKLYTEMVVGFEEVKEKVADMKAEVDAGFHSS